MKLSQQAGLPPAQRSALGGHLLPPGLHVQVRTLWFEQKFTDNILTIIIIYFFHFLKVTLNVFTFNLPFPPNTKY